MRDLAPMQLSPAADRDAPAVRLGPETRSWDDVERRARRLAAALDADLDVGAVWAVLSHNRTEWMEWMLAMARSGTRLVPLNWHLTAVEIAALLGDSGASLVIVGPGLEELADEAAALAGVERVVRVADDYEAWIGAHPDTPLDDRASGSPMLFTGGTTGRSKGVTRSDQSAPVSNWPKVWGGWGDLVRKPADGPTLISTPLYHALGLAVFTSSIVRGLPVVLMDRFDPEGVLAAIAEHRITATPMVPTQFIRLLKLPDEIRSAADLSSLQWVLHTAAPCPAWAKRAMIDWFGPVIYEMYGSSEGTGPALCTSEEWLTHPGTVGKATARVTYSIVDDDGNDLPPGEIGTIYCRRTDGPPEYHDDPEKTASIRLPDGRFTVGDLGWLDDEGFLYLADRRVDLIITGGSNVYPAEIEATLIEHADVADVAVFGIPDPEWGQSIMAVIEAPPGVEVDVDAVRAFAAERLARYKIPAVFEVTDALPREAHGKLKKRLLRDPYWADA